MGSSITALGLYQKPSYSSTFDYKHVHVYVNDHNSQTSLLVYTPDLR